MRTGPPKAPPPPLGARRQTETERRDNLNYVFSSQHGDFPPSKRFSDPIFFAAFASVSEVCLLRPPLFTVPLNCPRQKEENGPATATPLYQEEAEKKCHWPRRRAFSKEAETCVTDAGSGRFFRKWAFLRSRRHGLVENDIPFPKNGLFEKAFLTTSHFSRTLLPLERYTLK